METEPKPSFLEHALTHLSLIDETDLSERVRLHLHFARMFVALQAEEEPRPAAPGAGRTRIPRSGDVQPRAAG